MNGFLLKKSPALHGKWQNRFFELKERKLKYFEFKKKNVGLVKKGVINFDEYQC